MKRFVIIRAFAVAVVLALSLSLLGCAAEDPAQPEQGGAEPSATDGLSSEPEDFNAEELVAAGIDVDLTAMSATMVLAEVSNMMLEPESYVGKTIRLSGPYYSNYVDHTDKRYHFIVITDALACCQNGVEFNWLGQHSYPEDYPNENDEIVITGAIRNYEEYGQVFCLIDAVELDIVSSNPAA